MKSYQIILIIFCFNIQLLPAQPHGEDGIFAYAHNASGALATYKLKESKYRWKHETTQKVMDDLVEAKGVLSMPVPTLVMNNSERRVAWAKPDDAIIGLEEKAYDLCTTFGSDSLNALAALLAHELTHYYEKHDWKNRFIRDFGGSNHSDNAHGEKLDIETQADFLGGFLAFTAGYNTLDIMPQFLEKVYREYGFPDEIKGYPSLAERQRMATKSLEKLENLIDVFEMANYLTAAENYEGAKAYYEYILIKEKYQSREMYNNLGVTAILAAFNYFGNGELKFHYPVELDITSRLILKSGPIGYGEIKMSLLNDAIQNFKTALNLDQNYAPAMLNLGCAYTLTENYFDAQYHAQKALQMGQAQENSILISDAQVLLGIIAARQGQNEKSKEWFEKAVREKSVLGELNLKILKEETIQYSGSKGLTFAAPEKIEGLQLDQLVNQLHTGGLEPQKQVEINKKTLFALINYSSSRTLINFMPFDEAYNFFHITAPSYSGQTNRGIGIGDSYDKVADTENYGAPERIVTLTNGQYLIYPSRKILFQIDENNVVKSWAVFREQRKKDE